MENFYEIRCPQCRQLFKEKGTSYAQEIECPACSHHFCMGSREMVFHSEDEKAAFLERFTRRLDGSIAPILDKIEREKKTRQDSLVVAADRIFDEFFGPDAHYSPPDLDPVLAERGANRLLHNENATAVNEDMSTSRSKPSHRQHMLSVPMECLVETVLAAFGAQFMHMLRMSQGLLITEMPLPRLQFFTRLVEGSGSIVVVGGTSLTTLSVMNYNLLKYMQYASKRRKGSEEFLNNIVRLAWYFERGRQDHFDRAFAPMMDAIVEGAAGDEGSLSLASALAEAQVRFLIAHELAHVVTNHTDDEDIYERSGEPKHEGRHSFRTIEGIIETTHLNRQQLQELEADLLAAELCLKRDEELNRDYGRFAHTFRKPEVAFATLERQIGEGSKELWVQGVELFMIYLIFMGLCRDEYLNAHLRAGSYSLLKEKLNPAGPASHPWPELRLQNFREYCRNAGITARWTDALLPLTDRFRFSIFLNTTIDDLLDDGEDL